MEILGGTFAFGAAPTFMMAAAETISAFVHRHPTVKMLALSFLLLIGMLLVNADLTEADHVHPEEPATRGPVVTFQPLMPAAGTYKLWFQFQRHGTVTTVPFVIAVTGP